MKKALEYLIVLFFLKLVLCVSWQVLSRYTFQSPTAFTEELARFLLIWLIMLTSVLVQSENKHLKLSLFKENLVLTTIIAFSISVFIITALIIGGSYLCYITFSLEQYSPVLQLPLSFIYAIIPASGLLMLFSTLKNLKNGH